MALTANQQTQMNQLKADIKAFKDSLMQSSTAVNLFGSHLFDSFQKIDAQVTKVEQA